MIALPGDISTSQNQICTNPLLHIPVPVWSNLRWRRLIILSLNQNFHLVSLVWSTFGSMKSREVKLYNTFPRILFWEVEFYLLKEKSWRNVVKAFPRARLPGIRPKHFPKYLKNMKLLCFVLYSSKRTLRNYVLLCFVLYTSKTYSSKLCFIMLYLILFQKDLQIWKEMEIHKVSLKKKKKTNHIRFPMLD